MLQNILTATSLVRAILAVFLTIAMQFSRDASRRVSTGEVGGLARDARWNDVILHIVL